MTTLDELYDMYQELLEKEYFKKERKTAIFSSPLQYAGGKHIMREWIYKFFPRHCTYVEVFGGGGSMLFFKKLSKVEIYNDIDDLLVSFFRVLRDHPKDLFKHLYFLPYSRAEFIALTEIYQERKFLTEMDKAVCYYFINRLSFNGRLQYPVFSYTASVGKPINYRNKIANIFGYWKRISRVLIENLDFETLLEKYDSSDTFFYLDPPYYHADTMYSYQFTRKEHERLRKRLEIVQGKFLLSYDDRKEVHDLYPASKFYYHKKKFVQQMGNVKSSQNEQRPSRVELLIANYDIKEEKKFHQSKDLWTFIKEDDEENKKEKKKK